MNPERLIWTGIIGTKGKKKKKIKRKKNPTVHVHTRVWVVKIALAASVQIASKMEGLEIANGTSQHDWMQTRCFLVWTTC